MDWLAQLDPRVLIFGIAFAGFLLPLPFLVISARRLRRVKLVRGTMYFLFAAVLFLVLEGAALVATNLVTYARLAEREFAVSVQTPARAPQHYKVSGDEWQIDARVLKWRAMGTILGFDTVYRLERLSGRYGDVQSERSAQRTVYELAQDPGVDFWSVARRYPRYLPFADALYGSAAYVPMAEGAEYVVTVSASGLVVRPANDAARNAVGGWK
jgi:hypothetical protein